MDGNKIEAIEMLKKPGYTVKDACNSLGISRSGYYSCKGARNTDFVVSSIGWVYLVIVLDWITKNIVG